jgi:predicted TPR repeat methyltransferase
VRTLFDQYAPRFDEALAALSYSAPALLHQAVTTRRQRFGAMLDLGCGTGLAGAVFRPHADWLMGVDLAPKMIEAARAKGLYDKLAVADIAEFLREQEVGAFHLVVAADVFVYVADLAPVCAAIARVLAPDGLLAFTVETHAGEGVVLGEKLRFAHGAAHVRTALEGAGLSSCQMTQASTRTENGVPVPGLLVVAEK